MLRWLNRSLIVAASLVCSATSFEAAAQSPGDWRPTNLEIYQLPRFCWKQFGVPNVDGPEFTIQNCGPYMNHYCFGLTYLLRAKKYTGKGKPVGELQRAAHDIYGAEAAIKDYPQCSIRQHIADTRAEVDHLLRMYGAKPPPTAAGAAGRP